MSYKIRNTIAISWNYNANKKSIKKDSNLLR